MYKVVLVDDENLILEGLTKVVPWQSMNCEVCGRAINGTEGLDLIRKIRPDILMTDIRMPNMDGLTMIAAVRSEFPNMAVTVLTAYRDFDYAQRALHLGVTRYLLKPSKMDEIHEAIDAMTRQLARAGIYPETPSSEPELQDGEPAASEASNFIVNEALRYMQDHCREHIALADVAGSVYVSQWHLSKLLNRHTGQGFLDILAGMRIDLAKELLRDPAMRIYDVAEQCGYTDVAHFSKSFKKITGQTPGEYRQTLG